LDLEEWSRCLREQTSPQRVHLTHNANLSVNTGVQPRCVFFARDDNTPVNRQAPANTAFDNRFTPTAISGMMAVHPTLPQR
jgi:hypothetical protein